MKILQVILKVLFFTNQFDNSKKSSNGSISSPYDNYNHYNGSSTPLQNGATFNGPNGSTLVVTTHSDGTQTLQVNLVNGQPPMIFITDGASKNSSSNTYYGPNGSTARVVTTNNGSQAINIQTGSGESYTYTQSGTYYNPDNTTSTQYYGSTGYPIQQSSYSLAYETPYGGTAGSITGPANNTAYYAQGPNGNGVAGISPYPNYNNNISSNQYNGPYGGSAGSITGPANNTAYYAQGPNGYGVAGVSNNSGYGNTYSSTMSGGIPANQIPSGHEDLYILKSEIVPPVCPVCPTSSACPRQEPCPACPPCGRCPEPSFECKKVPNYNAIDEEYLPQPVLNDFSQFGM
jgi:hypothetical protein